MRAEGQRQREEIIAAGHAQIEADRKAAARALRQDVGKLATELAGKIVGESLEDVARQSRVVDRFLDGLDDTAAKAEASR
jgi:F-type H+-transporting ATPase subunit b